MSWVFICYAREDRECAESIFHALKAAGCNPWIDVKNLMPGARWKPALRQAIRESNCVIAVLSSQSVTKRGFVQQEIREALQELRNIPENYIFVIPVRLDPCNPRSEELRELHWLDLFPDFDEGLKRLVQVILKHESSSSLGPADSSGSPNANLGEETLERAADIILQYAYHFAGGRYGERHWFSLADLFQNWSNAYDRKGASTDKPHLDALALLPTKPEPVYGMELLDNDLAEAAAHLLVTKGHLVRRENLLFKQGTFEITDAGRLQHATKVAMRK
jgi:TIR domain-containing protein